MGLVATGLAATGPAAKGPAATGPAVTGPAATGPAVTVPAATGPALTGPALMGPAVSGLVVTAPAVLPPRAARRCLARTRKGWSGGRACSPSSSAASGTTRAPTTPTRTGSGGVRWRRTRGGCTRRGGGGTAPRRARGCRRPHPHPHPPAATGPAATVLGATGVQPLGHAVST